MIGYGFRDYKVFESATEGTFATSGGVLMVEVTNDGEDVTYFYPNHEFSPSRKPQGIPIPAGETRRIPMVVYHFRADDPVTVVGYRQ